jgi:hypothetical protein
MLNYNLNIIEPLKQDKKNEDVRPPIEWSFQSFATASDSTDLGELGFATMSINAPGTDCIQVSNDDTGFFTTDAQFPVTASLTGSNWPITGSTTMSLFTAGITYDPASVNQFYFAAISASALDIFNNPSYTGSVILNEFSASEFFRFYVEGKIVHTKGNIYNPIVNWKAINQSPSTDTGNVNGFTASFNIVKDRNVPLVSIAQVTGSTINAFNNQYALNITSSLTASVLNDATGSTTMSIVIPNAGISTSSLILNQTTPGFQTISASFTASNNNPYNITASVIMNKGNIWNARLNVLSTGSNADSYSMYTIPTQFNIIKDINVDSTVIQQNVSLLSLALTASREDTLQTNYAFNFQNDITESNTYPVYQVFTFPTTSLDITPAGTSSIRYDSGSIISYTEFPYTSSYNITASAWINKIPSFAANVIVIGGGGSGAGGTFLRPGGGGGAGAYYQNDIQIYPNKTYTIDYVGLGGATALTGSRGNFGGGTSLTIWEGLFRQPTTMSIIAGGGYGGGFPVNENFTDIINGGKSGFTYTQIGDVTTTVTQNYDGVTGNADDYGGGGAGQLGSGVFGNGGYLLGGAGGSSINTTTFIYSGSFAPTSSYEGDTLAILTGSSGFGVAYPNNNGNAATAYGGGGGGASRTDTFGTTRNGGAGGSGVVILSYSGSQKVTGGNVTFANGITTHTFTTASTFIYAVEPKPNPSEQPYQWRTDTLVIAGGGSGGSDEGGGGGAGGYSYNPYVYYELGKTYSVNVGAGQPGINQTTGSLTGSNSYIVDTTNGKTLLLALGGGAGFAAPGGSGGGASNAGAGGNATYGLNVNPNFYVPLFQSQGFGGGSADPDFGQAGGGGGAANSGSNGTGNPNNSGIGGIGKYDLSFTPIGVCGGGNSFDGDALSPSFTIFGGGGPCLNQPNSGSSAPANRGGGGGGARGVNQFGGAGGSGKVQIRYAGTQRATGGQIETGLISGSYYTLHTFTASGNFIPIA